MLSWQKNSMRWRMAIIGLLFVSGGAAIYLKSYHRKLQLTNRIYEELQHPDWSTRVTRGKATFPNGGSGHHKWLYLVDARKVIIPLNDAIQYYKKETERLGFRECHVDPFTKAQEKFQGAWGRMGLEIPSGDDILVISQSFTSDSTIRRHQPAEPAADGNHH